MKKVNVKHTNKELKALGFKKGFTQGDFYWKETLNSICFTKADRSEMEVVIRGRTIKVNDLEEAIELLSNKTSHSGN